MNYSDRCGPAFVEELQQHGHRVRIFLPRKPIAPDWQAVTLPNLRVWLRSLSRPVGVLAWGPEWGRKVTDACRVEGIRVPDEVGVITTEDDELMCEISHPTLSAVDERPRIMGYEAAALLDRMMSGQQTARNSVLIPPQRVITRRSTDVIAIADPDVAAALRFIRDHYVEPIDVRHLLNVVPISRRILEQKFNLAIGRSPAAEIRRVRLARATELLASTDWPIWNVAKASGFAHVEGMNRVFQRELQQTPSGYRRQ
jgi:LacI family transcriptional regulator